MARKLLMTAAWRGTMIGKPAGLRAAGHKRKNRLKGPARHTGEDDRRFEGRFRRLVESCLPQTEDEGGRMERIEAFEAMLKAVLEQSEAERRKMKALKAQGKEKTATYRQYLGNRLFYNQLFALYRKYGLIGRREE